MFRSNRIKLRQLIIRFDRSVAYRFHKILKSFLAWLNFPNYKIQLYRLNHFLSDPNRLLKEAVLLHEEHPNRPEPVFKIAEAKYQLEDRTYRDEFKKYQKIRQKWLTESGLNSFNTDIIWLSMYVGSLGNHRPILTLIKAKKMGLADNKSTTLILPNNSVPRNKTFLSYFEPYITIISDDQISRDLDFISDALMLPIHNFVPIQSDCVGLNYFNHIIAQNIPENGEMHFKLSAEHKAKGDKILRKFGVPEDA